MENTVRNNLRIVLPEPAAFVYHNALQSPCSLGKVVGSPDIIRGISWATLLSGVRNDGGGSEWGFSLNSWATWVMWIKSKLQTCGAFAASHCLIYLFLMMLCTWVWWEWSWRFIWAFLIFPVTHFASHFAGDREAARSWKWNNDESCRFGENSPP